MLVALVLTLVAPSPPPAKPNVSPVSETRERSEVCCSLSSTATTRGGSAAFAMAVRNASRGAARPSERLQRAYSWTSPETESERFVARRKERATRSMG
jgi:hypothetical protein